ncbi:MAG: dTMP kinase, partial [Rhodospirillaceae bacterium]|nr:dTMP kinase [Rhodospirillaceae bacterium]
DYGTHWVEARRGAPQRDPAYVQVGVQAAGGPRVTGVYQPRGRFITFEGGEGAGKSTQVRSVAIFLERKGIDFVLTREPGGTSGAEAIRELLVTGSPARWDSTVEALLNTASRRDHVERVIRPALEKGRWILCDRFLDSTMVYQGYAGGIQIADLERLTAFAIGTLKPDITFILDIPVAEGLARTKRRRGHENRFENREDAFHEAVRIGFQKIAQRASQRCVLLDATQPEETVTHRITSIIQEKILIDV